MQHRHQRLDDPLWNGMLSRVAKPSRYIGGEWNEIVKPHDSVDITFALGFPDVYEIGMSHLGYRILYSLLNDREDTAAERVFCPWPDMAGELREHDLPLETLETGTALSDFDVVGFSLQYEMTFTNVLEMLDLGRIPLRSADRGEDDPLVVVGGPVVFNVEPLAPFIDLVFVGDGEEMIPEFLELLRELKGRGASREETLLAVAQIEGIYAPALYDVEKDEKNGLLIPIPTEGLPYPVKRRILMDLDEYPFPDRIIVPHGEIVHDRVSVEIMRGCPVGCRFCQAGYIYRPTRERDPNQIRDTVIRSVRATGYDQFSLSSLNTGEYGSVQPVMFDLMDRFEPENVSISLSSMHASTITPELAKQVRRVRKSGFTIAPEAGTQRMRNVINKNLEEEQILTACRLAFEAGWEHIKLYFMIGLPTETDADVDGLVDLAHKIAEIGKKVRGRTRRPYVTLAASSFIPKPETPFQWLGMVRPEEIYRKQDRIAKRVRRGVRFKHHECETSYLEGVFSRGDRALAPVLEKAWRYGARFDGWGEHFNLEAWQRALKEEEIDADFYAHSDLDPNGRLPWQVVHSRVNRKWLAIELKRAMEQATLTICGPKDCHGCAPFARDCVKGIVSETTDRPFRTDLPVLATPAAPGPHNAAGVDRVPPLPKPVALAKDGVELPPEPERPKYRYRARFRKSGPVRFLGHLDVVRLLTRGIRRAGVPLVYSQGFNPKPKISFGPALSLGFGSEGEYMDFESWQSIPAEMIRERVRQTMPPGLDFDSVRVVKPGTPSLGDAISAATYRVILHSAEQAERGVEKLRAESSILIERVGKNGRTRTFDLVDEMESCESVENGELRFTLSINKAGASVKPEEALRSLVGEVQEGTRIVREDLLVDWHGRRVNPMLAAAASDGVRTPA